MSGAAKGPLVRFGDIVFRWRNLLFPVIVLGLVLAVPPAATLGGSAVLDGWRDGVAMAVVVLGLAIRFYTIGWAYIQRGGRNKRVYADDLVTSGCFALCRNPLYVGNVVLYAGVFLLHGAPLVIAAGIAAFVVAYVAIVAAEEHFLRERFGAAYAEYCADVPRWWPRLGRLREATAGMRFSLRRSVTKDYTTIVNAALAVIAVEVLERVHHAPPAEVAQSLRWAAVGVVVLLVAGVAAKVYKKRTAPGKPGNAQA